MYPSEALTKAYKPMAKFFEVPPVPRLLVLQWRRRYLRENDCQPSVSQPSGFSLTELLVTLGIIVVLAALLISGVSTLKNRSNALRCVNNLSQIGRLATLWSSDNNGTILPLYVNNDARTVWVRRLLPYMEDNLTYENVIEQPVKPGIFVCPAASSRL
ncbi:MAG: type II secretion system protein [Chthoniobacterales bacterium]